jgi:hypothetical protein
MGISCKKTSWPAAEINLEAREEARKYSQLLAPEPKTQPLVTSAYRGQYAKKQHHQWAQSAAEAVILIQE